ncbi:SDR family oxidoreductase [Sinimarinibacterium sp. CAU 1509]|uniref:SDR family oxidoreductase n=1 Tax=Sinimarinibacterium sp. CAU 1509 TaxID=2562283 RepID=UPI0010AC6D8D|nr:SDR family oxidoreductase [Sinimarinibacterium sp. CAU 1509]TJY60977.1 SDR family oxidoreductase [Sinimarinibacterium sp. CAU 1509]
MSKHLPKASIFITGAAAGIGRETARVFAARGWRVGAYDVDLAGLQSLKAECSGDITIGTLDVVDAEACKAAVAEFASADGGRLDVMFNNAGILSVGHFEDIDVRRHHAIVDINLKGVINGCLAALPHLRATPGSRVISMASASAIYGSPDYASYSATKFAVRGLTEALDIEWSRFGIRVMDIMPLFVKTAMVTDIEQPISIGRLGIRLSAQDIAQTVWRAAHWSAWRRVHWYPGIQTRAMSLANALSPGLLNRATVKTLSGY